MTQAGDQAPYDLDEDLFDFAGVAGEADGSEPVEDIEDVFASFRPGPPEEELLAVPAASAHEPALPAPAPAPARATESIAPSRPPAPALPAPPRSPDAVHEPARAARQSPLSKSVLAIALSVTVLNGLMAVTVLRGRPSTGDVRPPQREEALDHDEGGTLAAPPHAAKAAKSAQSAQTALPDPEAVDPVHAHPALDQARAEISRGEYSAARQRVYGLLAIVDRLEDPRRGALEADCQFLIAQSLHLEALARMGGAQ